MIQEFISSFSAGTFSNLPPPFYLFFFFHHHHIRVPREKPFTSIHLGHSTFLLTFLSFCSDSCFVVMVESFLFMNLETRLTVQFLFASFEKKTAKKKKISSSPFNFITAPLEIFFFSELSWFLPLSQLMTQPLSLHNTHSPHHTCFRLKSINLGYSVNRVIGYRNGREKSMAINNWTDPVFPFSLL